MSRESTWLEFKESYGFASLGKYLKSFAAYANTRGGYIVFGVANNPHVLKGLKGKALEVFESTDPERISQYLNEHFSPEINWDIHEHDFDGKTFGLIYIYESNDKPVVCKKDSGQELKEGDIYYRYRGRSERIKYPELRTILDIKREKEQQLWMHHFSQIARIGVHDVGIFDIQTGQVTGTTGSFLIDESLLSHLSFIKEGEFSEVKGKPALKLIGNVESVSGEIGKIGHKKIIKTKGIRIGDIVIDFLSNSRPPEPKEYIKQITYESTAFLPVYYYMKLANLKLDSTIELLNGVLSRCRSKMKLIERLKSDETQQLEYPTSDSRSGKQKLAFISQIKGKAVDDNLSIQDLTCCLKAIRCLPQKEIKKQSSYIMALLRKWFNQYYSSADANTADNLRRTICWVDEALYK